MTALTSMTLFLSAWLLFTVQPMVAKHLLPELGGTPLVWNTCLVFFQSILLGGYCYAHILSRRISFRHQLLTHSILLPFPLLLCGLSAASGENPLYPFQALREWLSWGVHPIVSILIVLATGIGLASFMLSSNAPLLQHWYSCMKSGSRCDPYFLYAASNAGSLTALLGYPVIECYLDLYQQAWVWCGGYLGLSILIIICTRKLWKTSIKEISDRVPELTTVPPYTDFRDGARTPMTGARMLRWMALAAGPSSLLMSVTNVITTDVAAVPLIWVIPLALYLTTYILAFGRKQWIPYQLVIRYLPLVLILWAIPYLIKATEPASVLFVIHLTAFFLMSLACHGALHRDRPAPDHLTSFYLCLSAGGVLGSIVTAFLAPLVFDDFFEYPIVMIVCFALTNRMSPSERISETLPNEVGSISLRLIGDIAIALTCGLFVVAAALGLDAMGFSAARSLDDIQVRYLRGAAFALPLVILSIWSHRTLRFLLGFGIILLGAHLSSLTGQVIYNERTWFGVHRVTWDPGHRFHQIVHCNTVHGRQRWPPIQGAPPSSYYHPTGPLQDVFESQRERGTFRQIAIAGLGAGCIAHYGHGANDQHWTFFEIDPAVVRIASDPRFFTFLHDTFPEKTRLNIVIGDARLKMAEQPDAVFDLIVLDVFSSDSIPVHLLTQEALIIYKSKLADKGMLVFHISNRHLDLRGLLASLAGTYKAPLVCFGCDDLIGAQTPQEVEDGKMPSQWVVMARHISHLGPLADRNGRWEMLPASSGISPWTDSYANILAVLKRE